MRSPRNSDRGVVHVLGKFAVLAYRVCSFYIIRPCSSSLQRLKPTANFQHRESAVSNRARRATLNFFPSLFFLLSFLFHGKAASPGDLVAPKDKSGGSGPAERSPRYKPRTPHRFTCRSGVQFFDSVKMFLPACAG